MMEAVVTLTTYAQGLYDVKRQNSNSTLLTYQMLLLFTAIANARFVVYVDGNEYLAAQPPQA